MTLERNAILNKRYKIVEILGQGGMASVYKAIDENLGVPVAVKENLFTTEEYARQFRLEAVILANLRHANMPRVTDHFVIEGQGQYLVMDYIEGEDLRQRMDRMGTIPEDEAIIIGVAICNALTYLHTRKPVVLHRDIKPGNVKITPQGHIFLVDFGLAKVMNGGEATTTGARAMTPGYSPPEQYGTARTDHRTDVYSLGATLYASLSDALPEDGLARAMDQTRLTPLRQLNPKISRRLASSIEKALAIKPDDRYQSAEDFQRDLLFARSTTRRQVPVNLVLPPPPPLTLSDSSKEMDLNSEDEEPPNDTAEPKESAEKDSGIPEKLFEPSYQPFTGPRLRNGQPGWLMFSFLFLVLIIGSGALFFSIPGSPLRSMSWLHMNSTPTSEASLLTQTAIALDARTTATHTVMPTSTPTQAFTGTPAPSATPIQKASPEPTPLGGRMGQVAFASNRSGIPQIWLLTVSGASPVQITNIPDGACQPAWSPDGLRLVFISPCTEEKDAYMRASLYIINIDGSQLEHLPTVPGGDYNPDWSPDGKEILFTSMREDGVPRIYVMTLEDKSLRILKDPDDKPNFNPVWSPDGKLIAFVGARDQIFIMDSNGENRRLISRNMGDYHSKSPHWSPDGQTIVFTQWATGTPKLSWLAASPLSGGIPGTTIARDFPMDDAAYSYDGQWLVYQGWPDGSNHDIYLSTSNGASQTRLTTDEAYDFDPAWRP